MLAGACLAPHAQAWDLFVSATGSYTHYDAADLNRVLLLLEETTKEQGFNPYNVNQFDGHPSRGLTVGFQRGPWKLGLEAEFWVESFEQTEVPFDLEEAEREYRITCADLRAPGFDSQKLYGCVDAHEIFNILPITLQGSYGMDLGRHFRVEAGYGLGVLAGSATIELATEYFGEGALPRDKTRFQVWPGINSVQKAFADVEYLPWRFLGISARLGWRIQSLKELTLRKQEGESRIFKTVFPEAKNGAHMYIQSFTDNPDDDKIYVGTEADARERAAHDGSHFHLVNGDFTGWLVGLKLNLYWRDL